MPGGEIPHWPWFRRALSRYGNLYAAFVLGTGVKDATSGYRAYRADTLKSIDYATTRSKGYGFQIETEYRVHSWGGRITEVPIVFTDRVRGYSKMSWFIFAEELLLVTWWGMRDRARRLWRRRSPRLAPASPFSSWYSASTFTVQTSWSAPKMFSTESIAVYIEWSWLLYLCMPLRPTGIHVRRVGRRATRACVSTLAL